jgi:hypothetical protein
VKPVELRKRFAYLVGPDGGLRKRAVFREQRFDLLAGSAAEVGLCDERHNLMTFGPQAKVRAGTDPNAMTTQMRNEHREHSDTEVFGDTESVGRAGI